jgi:predicted ATPase
LTESERWYLFQAVATFMRSLAAERRAMLVIDDLQWAEPATRLLLRHLASALIDGLLIVATARTTGRSEPGPFTEALADLAGRHLLDTITLGGLNPQEVAALVAARLDCSPSEQFVQALHDETGGNAFFIHELVSHLADTGLLQGPDGAWPTAMQLEQSGAS